MKITDYNKIKGSMFDVGADVFVRNVVKFNLSSPRKDNRSINGGQVGNRHALKRGIRMWDHSGHVIDRGTHPIKSEEYYPSF